MKDSQAREIELTPDLLDYVERSAIKEARKRCPKWVNYRDVAQDVVLNLLRKPPRFDPTRGTKVKTLLHTAVRCHVVKYVARECKHGKRFSQVVDESTPPRKDKDPDNPPAGTEAGRRIAISQVEASKDDAELLRTNLFERQPARLSQRGLTAEDVVEFIRDRDSRALCRLVLELDGNVSEAARRLGLSEGTVRYRLKTLAPKILAAGFNPFNTRRFNDHRS